MEFVLEMFFIGKFIQNVQNAPIIVVMVVILVVIVKFVYSHNFINMLFI